MTITKRTVKKLWIASGNQCAYPECDQDLIDFDNDTVIGMQCHIRARNPDGPRFDEEMTEEERDSFSNLLLMCPTHHRIVDETPGEYTVETLEEWKRNQEKNSPQVEDLDSNLLNQLVAKLNPTMLLIYVDEDNINLLRDQTGWEPEEVLQGEKDNFGNQAILVTFDNLKDLLGRVSTIYRQKMNGRPLYKETSDWEEDEIIAASCISAHIAKSAIQYYQVEGNRRQSEYLANFSE